MHLQAPFVNRHESSNSQIIFNKTRTYWWRGKTTGGRAATGTSRDKAGVHRHWHWAGCEEKYKEKYHFVVQVHDLSNRKTCQHYCIFMLTKNSHSLTY